MDILTAMFELARAAASSPVAQAALDAYFWYGTAKTAAGPVSTETAVLNHVTASGVKMALGVAAPLAKAGRRGVQKLARARSQRAAYRARLRLARQCERAMARAVTIMERELAGAAR